MGACVNLYVCVYMLVWWVLFVHDENAEIVGLINLSALCKNTAYVGAWKATNGKRPVIRPEWDGRPPPNHKQPWL